VGIVIKFLMYGTCSVMATARLQHVTSKYFALLLAVRIVGCLAIQ
jgi:hypothetical protein